ncbi:MAG: cytochrome-c peroxidase [Burkholderiaceae bacterium]|nr:cytochrome-c peroxidase [Burkholderiaceae bacterium]
MAARKRAARLRYPLSRRLSTGLLVIALAGCGWVEGGSPPAATDADTALKTAVETAGGVQRFVQPRENDFERIPQDPSNPLTEAKVRLGAMLFHDTSIAGNPAYPDMAGTYSCASCHHASAGFQAGLRQGIGEGGLGFGRRGEKRVADPMYRVDRIDVQPLRSPAALNVAYQSNLLWNGQFGAGGANVGTESAWTAGTPKEANRLGFEGVETQAIAGMGVHRLKMDRYLAERLGYLDAFDAAFPERPAASRYDEIASGLAIAAYERTLLANRAPFQRWLQGETWAMTESQKRGAVVFFGKAGCVGCHDGPALSSMQFAVLGMGDLVGKDIIGSDASRPDHQGRASFTGRPQDQYAFKTPQLYNLREARYLGHGGTFDGVEAVVRYKNLAAPQNERVAQAALDSRFVPLHLTAEEIAQLVDFIENALNDPSLSRYVPASLPTGRCSMIVADPASRIESGCDQSGGD